MTLHVANHMRTQQVRSWGWRWVQLSGALRLLLLTRCCCSRVAEQTSASATHGTHRPNAPTEAELSLAHEVRAYAHSFTLTRRTRVRGSASDHGS